MNSFHLRTMYWFSSITAFQQATRPMRSSNEPPSRTAPTAGSLTMSPDGSFTLTGHPGGATWVTFTYTIINVFGLTSTATVWIGNGDAGLTCKP